MSNRLNFAPQHSFEATSSWCNWLLQIVPKVDLESFEVGATSRLLDCKVIYDFESFKVDRIETSFNNTFITGNYYYTSVWLKVEYKVLIFSKGVWIFLMILKKKVQSLIFTLIW